jgi:hypothetical protein
MEPRSVRKEERNYGENYRLAKNRSLIRHAEPEPSVRGEDMEYVFGLSAKKLRKRKAEEKQKELERHYPKSLKPTIEQQIMAQEEEEEPLPFSISEFAEESEGEKTEYSFLEEDEDKIYNETIGSLEQIADALNDLEEMSHYKTVDEEEIIADIMSVKESELQAVERLLSLRKTHTNLSLVRKLKKEAEEIKSYIRDYKLK